MVPEPSKLSRYHDLLGQEISLRVLDREGLAHVEGTLDELPERENRSYLKVGESLIRSTDVVYVNDKFQGFPFAAVHDQFQRLNLDPARIAKFNSEPVRPDLSANNPNLDHLSPSTYIHEITQNYTLPGVGGYLEKRRIYEVSELFGKSEFRNIHLGVDLWQPANAPIFAPIDGFVIAAKDNDMPGDYGPTVILEHQVDGTMFFSLYGHLSRVSIEGLSTGQLIKKGEPLAAIGNPDENGGWPPHLHFQVMLDMLGNTDNFAGVCLEKELEFYTHLCPDPSMLIRF